MNRSERRDRRPKVLSACCALCAGLWTAVPLQAQTSGRILVMPFENVKRDGRIFWLGEASAVLLTDDLLALGRDPITRPERVASFEKLQVPPVAVLSDATVIRIGQIVAASEIILGSLELDGE